MPSSLLLVAVAAAAAYVALAPLRRGFVVLVASLLLLPATLVVPNGVTGLLTVHRVLLLVFLARLVVDTRRRRIETDAWRPTPVHAAFLVFLVVVLVSGVMFAAASVPAGVSLSRYLDLLEQALTLLACLTVVRVDDDPAWFLRPLAAVVVVSAGIGVVEHLTQWSWGHWLFSRLPSQQGVEAAAPLAHRAGDVRVRAGAEYPLGFAWVSVALLPAVVAVTMTYRRLGRVLLPAGVVIVLLAPYWSYSRSALAGLVVVAVVLALGARDVRVAAVVCVGAAVVGVVFLLVPSVSHHFAASVDTGSISVREQRLPVVLGAVAERPLTGLGLGGIGLLGLHATDATYLLSYAETGAVGLAALAGLLLVCVVMTARGLLVQQRRLRLAATAALAGVLVMVAAGLAFDALSLLGSADLLWVLVAIGVGVAERARGPVALPRTLGLHHAAAPAAALAAGVVVAVLAPVHHAVDYRFSTLPVAREVGSYDPVVTGTTLINTTCGMAQAQQRAHPGVRLDCRESFTGPGVGDLRVQAADASTVREVTAALRAGAVRAGVAALDLVPATPDESGRPSAARTAPLWLPVLTVMVLLLPWRAARRPRPPVPAVADRRGGRLRLPVVTTSAGRGGGW